MIHAVICEECDFNFEEVAKMPSDAWYSVSDHDHDRETGHEVRLVHTAV